MNLEKPTDAHTPDPANPQFGSGANGYPSALPQYTQLSQNLPVTQSQISYTTLLMRWRCLVILLRD